MKKPKLTIGLPLYRSGASAKKSFLTAYTIASTCPDTELVVCDNSPLQDRHYIHALLNAAPDSTSIRYIANSRNIGAAANLHKIQIEARGEYLQLLGDDDYLNPSLSDLCSLIFAPETDTPNIIASAPTFFVKGSCIDSTSFPKRYKEMLGSLLPSERVKAYLTSNSNNYLFYSMRRKDIGGLWTQWNYIANCPGFTDSIDWTVSWGLLLSNSILQLDHPYYVYNMENWSPSVDWRKRELDRYAKWINPDLLSLMNAGEILQTQRVNEAAVACSYFVSLAREIKSRDSSFDYDCFYRAACDAMLGYYLSHFRPANGFWESFLEPCHDSFLSLVDQLTNTIVNVLSCGPELRKFLLAAPQLSSGCDWMSLGPSLEKRYSNTHHVGS